MTKIDAALAARLTGGGEVRLPEGRWALASTLTITEPTLITGEGDRSVLVAPKGKPALEITAKGSVSLRDLVIEGSTVVPAISASGNELAVRGCTIRGPGYEDRDGQNGITVKGSCKLAVEGSSFEGFDCGVQSFESSAVTMTKVVCERCDVGAMCGGGGRFRVTGCIFRGNRIGFAANDAAVGEMDDCSVVQNREIGVLVMDTSEMVVRENRFEKNGTDGLHVRMKSRVRALYNVARGNAHTGVFALEEGELIAIGNLAEANGHCGIAYYGESSGEALHNVARLNQASGIVASDTASPRLEGNLSWRNALAGLGTIEKSRATLRGNHSSSNAESGIYIGDQSRPVVESNELVDNQQSGILIVKKAAPRVSRNLSAGNSWQGIATCDDSTPEITYNTACGNEENGIYACERSKPTLRGNLCAQNECDGICVADSAAPLVEGNELRQNTEDGLSITNKAKPVVRGNRILENEDAAIRIVGKRAKPEIGKNQMKGNGENEVVKD